MNRIYRVSSVVRKWQLNPSAAVHRRLSTKSGEDEWNDTWETAWLPDDLSGKSSRAPWESDVSTAQSSSLVPDPETQAFVEDMNDNWEQRKGKSVLRKEDAVAVTSSLENIKRDYRVKKQKIHAGLWVKEIEKLDEAKLGIHSFSNDIDKLLDTASEIFDSTRNDCDNPDFELKNKPDGWETTSKTQDGSIWDISQREEDILVQEFERRIAFNKFQIASFIKTHIFSRRRPIDGWKYMIEEIGPNARKGKGSAPRLPSVSDESTQPFREEKPTFAGSRSSSSYKGR